MVGQGGATLASSHPDTGRSPTAFKVQALARCTWVSSLPLPPDNLRPVEALYDPDGSHVATVSAATEVGGRLFLGNLGGRGVSVLQL